MSIEDVVVKLNFMNAFNSLRTDVMLNTVANELSCLNRFCHLAYGNRTALCFGEPNVWSMGGIQQGDPLGSLLFCLTIQPLLLSLSSQLIVAFMDDFTLAGDLLSVAADVNIVSSQGVYYGLQLNFSKCKAITQSGNVSHATFDAFQRFTPGTAVLFGAPLAAGQAMTECLTARCADLLRDAERLKIISAHDALALLKNPLSAPKLQYLLREDCSDGHDLLTNFDNILRSACAVFVTCP
jgi:hypothetical protein